MPKKKRFSVSPGGHHLGGAFPEETHRQVEEAATRLRVGKVGVLREALDLYLGIPPFWQNMLRNAEEVFGLPAGEAVGKALADYMRGHVPGGASH
jgi:hypothetical protein